MRIVCERVTNKPDCLFVGKKPVSSSIQERKHQRSDLPKIEGLTEYVSGNSCFLHIDDLFEETSLKALQNFGIKLVYIFSENWFQWHQFEYYGYTAQLIADFTWKNGKPFEIGATLITKAQLIAFLSTLLNWLTSHSHVGPIAFFKNVKTFELESIQIEKSIRWDRWKRKGDALYRLGDMARSFWAYTLAFRSLLAQNSRILSLPTEKKKGAAKMLTNISLLYLKYSSSQFSIQSVAASKTSISKKAEEILWNDLLFQKGFRDLPSSTADPLKALLVALYASTEFNICWCKSYERMKTGVKSLKEKYREFLENEKKTKNDVNDTRLQILIDGDKKRREMFWDASEIKKHVNQLNQRNPSSKASEFIAHLTEFRSLVFEYRNQLQSAI